MEVPDYPALYQSADAASAEGQSIYQRLVGADLVLVVLAAALAVMASVFPVQIKQLITVATAIIFVAAMVAKTVNRQRRDDRDWFDGRAVAESVKTESWRYMMRIDPFANDATCDQEFVRRLRAILSSRPNLSYELGNIGVDAGQISHRMRQIRALPLIDRRDLYVKERLSDQAEWYRSKSSDNKRQADRWFWWSLGAQFGAAVMAIIRASTSLDINLIGLLAALAAAFTAWGQLGRHEELSKAYALACQELLTIRTLADGAATDDQLAQIVSDGEGSISREHTMWMAKRGEPLPTTIPPAP